MKFFLCVIGMVLFIEGLPWFASPNKMRRALAMMFSQHERQLRVMGFMLMVIGLVLVYLGKH